MIRKGGAEIVDAVVEKTGVDTLTAAMAIGQRAKALTRTGIPIQRLGVGEWIQVFDLLTSGRIPREAIAPVAARMAKDGLSAEAAVAAEGIALEGPERWHPALDRLTMDGCVGQKVDTREKRRRFLMGRAMKMLAGKAPATEVAAFLGGQIEEAAR